MSCRTHRKRRSNESQLDTPYDDPKRVYKPTPCTLTRSTMDAVAADRRNTRLTRAERDNVLKFRVWPLIGDTRAVAVRPRISDQERRHAERLLHQHADLRPRQEQVAA